MLLPHDSLAVLLWTDAPAAHVADDPPIRATVTRDGSFEPAAPDRFLAPTRHSGIAAVWAAVDEIDGQHEWLRQAA
jgi:hypothetical protein